MYPLGTSVSTIPCIHSVSVYSHWIQAYIKLAQGLYLDRVASSKSLNDAT